MSVVFLAGFVAAMALATVLTRALPFWLPARWWSAPWVQTLRVGLPAVILLLLLVYSLLGVRWTHAPWGAREVIALAVTIGLHLWRRHALLSIGAGTATFMVLVQTNLLGVVTP